MCRAGPHPCRRFFAIRSEPSWPWATTEDENPTLDGYTRRRTERVIGGRFVIGAPSPSQNLTRVLPGITDCSHEDADQSLSGGAPRAGRYVPVKGATMEPAKDVVAQ